MQKKLESTQVIPESKEAIQLLKLLVEVDYKPSGDMKENIEGFLKECEG